MSGRPQKRGRRGGEQLPDDWYEDFFLSVEEFRGWCAARRGLAPPPPLPVPRREPDEDA